MTTVRRTNGRLTKTSSGLSGKVKRGADLALLGAVTAMLSSELGGNESELPRPVDDGAAQEREPQTLNVAGLSAATGHAQSLVAAAQAAGVVHQVTFVPVGHHQMNEAPEETLAAIKGFLR